MNILNQNRCRTARAQQSNQTALPRLRILSSIQHKIKLLKKNLPANLSAYITRWSPFLEETRSVANYCADTPRFFYSVCCCLCVQRYYFPNISSHNTYSTFFGSCVARSVVVLLLLLAGWLHYCYAVTARV